MMTKTTKNTPWRRGYYDARSGRGYNEQYYDALSGSARAEYDEGFALGQEKNRKIASDEANNGK